MGDKDLLARILAVIMAGVSALYASVASDDRFTGADGEVLTERVRRLERDVENLPPVWLREDIQEIKQRLRKLETDHEH